MLQKSTIVSYHIILYLIKNNNPKEVYNQIYKTIHYSTHFIAICTIYLIGFFYYEHYSNLIFYINNIKNIISSEKYFNLLYVLKHGIKQIKYAQIICVRLNNIISDFGKKYITYLKR